MTTTSRAQRRKKNAAYKKYALPPSSAPGRSTGRQKLTGTAWKYVWARTFQQFRSGSLTHTAASLSFYFLLALLPGCVAILSLLNVFGQGQETVTRVIDWLTQATGSQSVQQFEAPLLDLAQSPAGGPAFVIGIVGALFSAGRFVTAFGASVNEVYGMPEGRSMWRLRTQTLIVTVVAIILVVAILVCAIGSSSLLGPLGFSETAVTVWAWGRFPLAVLLALLLIILLYLTTGNVRRSTLNPATLGALIALFGWALLSAGLYLYAVVLGGFDSTYGSLAGVLIVLLWVWLSACALIFGIAFDVEVIRARQLLSGIDAEAVIQVEPRSDKKIIDDAEAIARFQRKGRALRESRGASAGEEHSLPR